MEEDENSATAGTSARVAVPESDDVPAPMVAAADVASRRNDDTVTAQAQAVAQADTQARAQRPTHSIVAADNSGVDTVQGPDSTAAETEAPLATNPATTGGISTALPLRQQAQGWSSPDPCSAAAAAATAGHKTSTNNSTDATSTTASSTATNPATADASTTSTDRGGGHGSLRIQPPPPPTSSIPQFVAPSSYLRPRPSQRSGAMAPAEPSPPPPTPFDKDQQQGLKAIRDFLKVRTSYDVLPLSFRLIVLDTDLLIKKSLNILTQNSIVSAPLWDTHSSRFFGILTATDYLNVIQYYCQFPDEISKLDQFRLGSLRDIERKIGAIPIETVSVHPSQPLYEACRRMLKTRARRIPLVDVDDETNREMVVSVITQYRILKFIAVNNEHNTSLFKKSVRELKLGTYKNLSTASMSSSVLDVVHQMVAHNISCVPIVDQDYRVLNVFEAVDIIPCIKGGSYEELDDSVGDALCKRPEDSPGIYTCGEGDRLESIFDTIRKSRVHRLIVVDDDNRLKGIVSLSDILKYVLLEGEEEDLQ